MIVLGFTALLFAIAAWMLLIARRRGDGSDRTGLKFAWSDFVHLLPRLIVGVIGAGFIAKALPQETVTAWLGPQSGWGGIAAATLAGALTPGGPVVGYAIGAAALKAGAGLPQVMAYVTGWALYTINRVIVWEIPTMPMATVVIRAAVSLPFPLFVAGLATLLG